MSLSNNLEKASSSKSRKAYSSCRAKKIKCSKTVPCAYCTRRDIECVWPENSEPNGGKDQALLSTTLLERREPFRTPTCATSTTFARLSSASLPSSPPPDDLAASLRPHVTTVAEGELLDHSILRFNSVLGKRKKHAVSAMRTVYPFGARGGGEGAWSDICRGLPDGAESDRLLRSYLERVEWIHHPLHIPTFLAQYNSFNAMSPSERSRPSRARWLALLYVVLCLGAHFEDDEDTELEERLLEYCEVCLATYDFMNEPSLETIQTINCLCLFLNNRDQVSSARALLATGIRLAQAMGLSRIPDETEQSDVNSVLRREMGRRLWWSMVCQDAYTASYGGMTYSINLAHSTTMPFANVEDEDVQDGKPRPPGKDMEEMTSSTYHLAKVGFALVVRDYIDAINVNFPNIAYSTVLALDVRYRQVFSTLPKQLRPDLSHQFDPRLTTSKRYLIEQRVFMGVTFHNRLMRLHRAFMSKGYEDGRYAYSTKACLSSAYDLLALVRQCKLVLCKWWVVVVQVWASGLVISVDMLRGEQDEAAVQKRREGVELAVSLLRPASQTSPVAERAVTVLQNLLDQSADIVRQHVLAKASTAQTETVADQMAPLPATNTELHIGDVRSGQHDHPQIVTSDNSTAMSVDSTLALLESLFPDDFADYSAHMMNHSQDHFELPEASSDLDYSHPFL